jgi:hypothetical protein
LGAAGNLGTGLSGRDPTAMTLLPEVKLRTPDITKEDGHLLQQKLLIV